MTEEAATSLRLITRCQAWFQAFVAVESLPVIDPQWIQKVTWSTGYRVLVRAWLGRGPLEHLVGQSMILYFDNGEDSYPTFQHPSTGPKGAGLKGAKVPRTLTASSDSAIFGIEVVTSDLVSAEMFEHAEKGTLPEAAVQPTLQAGKAALDLVVGAFALYQYPLVWQAIGERNVYFLVNEQTGRATEHREPLPTDNFIPFRLEPASKLVDGMLRDGVIESVASIITSGSREPLTFLKDSLWHSDIRTRFLLQFWIVEYFAEKWSATLPLDEEARGFVKRLEGLVANHAPADLERFNSKKGELVRRTLAEKARACLDHFKIQYDDLLFKRAKRVRDSLSHGSGYDQQELVLMEHYIREIARYLLQRDFEFKGIFLNGQAKTVSELPLIVPWFMRREGKVQTASFGPI
jgi:hypothetical protein